MDAQIASVADKEYVAVGIAGLLSQKQQTSILAAFAVYGCHGGMCQADTQNDLPAQYIYAIDPL